MAVHKVSESPITERLKLVPTHEDVPEQPKPTPPMRDDAREARNIAVLVQATATLAALARIVSARFILLLSVCGAFALGIFVIEKANLSGLVVMALYVLVVTALVALEAGVLDRLKG